MEVKPLENGVVVQFEFPQVAKRKGRGAYNLSMSRHRYCARCKHPESDHRNGMCSGQVHIYIGKIKIKSRQSYESMSLPNPSLGSFRLKEE